MALHTSSGEDKIDSDRILVQVQDEIADSVELIIPTPPHLPQHLLQHPFSPPASPELYF